MNPFAIDPGWRILLVDMGISSEALLRQAQLPADLFVRTDAALSSGSYTVPLKAAYYQTAASVMPGTANAVMTFTMTYQ
ncbi:fimbrial protein [Paraburkholderia sp. ZP32-5]|uniref:fimbrial protein n=1 Tax=Paraburkholderia sp. ZP32-5 TaxID=2883245 RepID=UPI001F2D3DF0|nr:hypothetical protein [Paraburkholderia sp. ZP32-5]